MRSPLSSCRLSKQHCFGNAASSLDCMTDYRFHFNNERCSDTMVLALAMLTSIAQLMIVPQVARRLRCVSEETGQLTRMVVFLPMRARRPTMAFSTVHSSRYAPWLMIASLTLLFTILAGGRNRGLV